MVSLYRDTEQFGGVINTIRAFGIYVHYPWCRSLCPYCDFPVTVAGKQPIPNQAYTDAILDELAFRADDFRSGELVSVYLGGGTPSLWPAEYIASVVLGIRSTFSASGPLEVTLEANPEDCTADMLAAWRAAGINRVSIGLQSFATSELVTLGRDHQVGHSEAAIRTCLRAGLERVSADLIVGVPGAQPKNAHQWVSHAADLGLAHLSIYELTYEPNTVFGRSQKRGAIEAWDEDALVDMYVEIDQQLSERGYEHYEISSYAKPGARAVHNALYWRGAAYLGLGCGAASFCRVPGQNPSEVSGRRWTNHRSVRRYLAAVGSAREVDAEVLNRHQLAQDYLWLGLRTQEGVPEIWLEERPKLLDWLLKQGLAEAKLGRVQPTLRGFLYADQVAKRVAASSLYN